jgi:hypothetical protein
MSQLSRRAVLRLLGVSGIGMSAGCVSASFLGNEDGKHKPGALVVKNQHSLPHVVNVSVTGPNSIPKSIDSENITGEALQVIETGLKSQIPIDANDTKVHPDFLSGSVVYTVKIWLGTTGAKTPPDANDDDNVIEVKFSPNALGTPDARGSFLTVQIEQTGQLSWIVTFLY